MSHRASHGGSSCITSAQSEVAWVFKLYSNFGQGDQEHRDWAAGLGDRSRLGVSLGLQVQVLQVELGLLEKVLAVRLPTRMPVTVPVAALPVPVQWHWQ